MSKAREATKASGEILALSSGVVVTVTAIPPKLLTRIQADNPDPKPPKKTVTVLGGTEEVDDLQNPEYLEAKQKAEATRNSKLGEAVVEFCIQVDMSKYESTIKRLEKYVAPYPDDPDERRIRFLYEYALRTTGDYSITQAVAVEQITVTEKEVEERIASFQANVLRPAANGHQAPGTTQGVGVEVVSETEGRQRREVGGFQVTE